MKAFALLLLLVANPASTPVHADVRPPPLSPPRDRTPNEAKNWAATAKHAMATLDASEAESLCDARGYHTNLVGPSGETLESLFAQGMRKQWHLDVKGAPKRYLTADQGAIVHATVKRNSDGKELDALWLLLVRVRDQDGTVRWRALGAGEELGEVDALATRFLAGKDLAPPPEEKPGE